MGGECGASVPREKFAEPFVASNKCWDSRGTRRASAGDGMTPPPVLPAAFRLLLRLLFIQGKAGGEVADVGG